ncbi:MAG TPA: Gfo/Idh/MocA family oxidoreductase [Chthonomonadaceae bacterium]|nr:Gfo/Idh/MocA family oxidoreductase [Chthonomonadaceae bacterium]
MTIRWGILGCGKVTEVKSGPGFQLAEGSRLVAVMRRTSALAEDYARRHNVPRWYDRADALIHDPEVDAVYIATPPGSHLEYALQVCAAGKPAYVEKPMARNYAECRRMVAAFTEAKLPLFVAYYRRGLPRFNQAKALVESGRLGQITGVCYRYAGPSTRPANPQELPWRLVAEQSGGGLFLDLGCHTLDILDYILGPLEDVEGTAANVASPYDVEDAVAMRFRLPSGGLGIASWNFASGVHEDTIEIFGSEGRLSLSTFGNEPLQLETAHGRETFDRPNPPHIQQPLIQTIVDELQRKGRCPSTGLSAARTSRVMDIVLEGYYGGRSDAFWDRPHTWPGRKVSPSSIQ